MMHRHRIELPQGICSDLTSHDLQTMVRVALDMAPLWENALGPEWQSRIRPDMLEELYRRI